jgi:tRNA A37 threonylcarbamoyltransferase TsaD
VPQYEYHVEPFIGNIKESENIRLVAEQLQNMINKAVSGGWEFDRIDTIQISVQPGCLGALLGAKNSLITHNFVIFRRSRTNS